LQRVASYYKMKSKFSQKKQNRQIAGF